MGDSNRPASAERYGPWTAKSGLRSRGTRALAALGVTSALLAAAGAALGKESALPVQLAQAQRTDTVQITVAPTIATSPASQAPLPIRIGPADALPKNSFLRVRGLPPTVSLTEGYATAPGAWAVPLYALSSLQMIVPAGVAGRADLNISVVGEDGTLLAEAKAVLVIQAPSPAPAAPKEKRAEPSRPPSPALPRGPLLSPADRENAEKLVARGEHEIELGNVAVARQFFVRAAQIGLARAALLLAATYDPRELARWGVQGVQPNLGEARKWYEKARELGAPEAEERLARLGGG